MLDAFVKIRPAEQAILANFHKYDMAIALPQHKYATSDG